MRVLIGGLCGVRKNRFVRIHIEPDEPTLISQVWALREGIKPRIAVSNRKCKRKRTARAGNLPGGLAFQTPTHLHAFQESAEPFN